MCGFSGVKFHWHPDVDLSQKFFKPGPHHLRSSGIQWPLTSGGPFCNGWMTEAEVVCCIVPNILWIWALLYCFLASLSNFSWAQLILFIYESNKISPTTKPDKVIRCLAHTTERERETCSFLGLPALFADAQRLPWYHERPICSLKHREELSQSAGLMFSPSGPRKVNPFFRFSSLPLECTCSVESVRS